MYLALRKEKLLFFITVTLVGKIFSSALEERIQVITTTTNKKQKKTAIKHKSSKENDLCSLFNTAKQKENLANGSKFQTFCSSVGYD